MKLAEMTWPEVELLSRDIVVVIPTGSLEQHGPHLPLFTDSILATAVSEAVEARLGEKMLLTPTLWLGASGHHLKFAGTLSAKMQAYLGAVESVVESLIPHGFSKFFIVNGHGGNSEPNGVAMRMLKEKYPNRQFGHSGYYTFAEEASRDVLTGPFKGIRHACEAEVSLMMHVRPELVRQSKLRDDGLAPEPSVVGMVHHFDEVTEEGSLGYATLATPEKGAAIFEAAVKGLVQNISAIADGYVFKGL
ncbi:MAG: creatininase family protein [Armatimonadetes bacterium]|nr:creatininase family protein [Armatimonadota bacterium]